MKATVKFYVNGEVIKTENFKTKLEAKKAINNYKYSVNIQTRVKNNIQSHLI